MHPSRRPEAGGARALGTGARPILLTITVACALASPWAAALSPTESSWPQFRGDDARLGVAVSAIPSSNTTLWERDLDNQVQGSFAVVGGRALVGSDDNRLYCLNADNGETLWTFETGNSVQSTPLVDGDRVYIGGLDGHLYCLRLDNGSLIWAFSCGMVVSSPALFNGTVFFGDQSGYVWGVDAATGVERWNRSFDGQVWASPTVVGGRVYIGDVAGNFKCLDASDGSDVWSKHWEGADIYSSAAVANGRVLVGTGLLDLLMCLDASTGDELWRFGPGQHVYSSAAVFNGVVYCHSWMFLWAVPWDDPDGSGSITPEEALWSFPTDDVQGGSSAAVSGGRVVVGTDAGRLHCVEAATGEEVWRAPVPGFVYASPAVAGGRVYVGSTSGRIACFGVPTVPRVYAKLTPTKDTVQGGQSITIDVFVSDASGAPAGDAFMAYSATAGSLSATFGTVVEGRFRVSWTAPQVGTTTIVRITATGELPGFEVVGYELSITVTKAETPPAPDVPRVGRPTVMVAVAAFIALDVLLGVVIMRRRARMGEVGK